MAGPGIPRYKRRCIFIDRIVHAWARCFYRIQGSQGKGKRVPKKPDELSLYEKYGTVRKGKGALIEPIKNPQIKFAVQIIAGKVMRHYVKGECTLYAISVAEFCNEGAEMNWCQYLLNELFQACADAHKNKVSFIYGYPLVSLAMMKYKPPPTWEVQELRKEPRLAMRYTPWRHREEKFMQEYNEKALGVWHT